LFAAAMALSLMASVQLTLRTRKGSRNELTSQQGSLASLEDQPKHLTSP
jgi:hypothetical protein